MLHPVELSQIATSLRGLPILGCSPGSPAARAGLRYGDIVLALDGTPTPSWTAFFEAARAACSCSLQLQVLRHDRELAVQLELARDAHSPRAVLDAPVPAQRTAAFVELT